MKKTVLAFGVMVFSSLLLISGWSGDSGTGVLSAREFKTKTVEVKGSRILVKTMGTVEVLQVKPSLRKRRGKSVLRYEVTIKNTGEKNESFYVSAEARAEDGIWLFGGPRRPTKVNAGEEKSVRINTRHERETLPKQIRVQVLQDFEQK